MKKSFDFERLLPILLILLLAAYLLSFAVINFCGFQQFCSGDMYEDTYVSRLMWEQKTLFPENWTFGNQFYVITTPVLAALFYGITGSMNLATAIATTVMTALILLSFIWMMRPFAKPKEILFGMLMLVASVVGFSIVYTIEGQILYLMASYYAAYLITLFVVFGDYMRFSLGKNTRFFTVAFFLSLILSYCTGMQSLRQTAIMVAPLIGYEALLWLVTLIKTKTLPNSLRIKSTLRVATVSAANLLGYLTSKLMDISHVTIYGDLNFISGERMLENVSVGFRSLKSITGIKYLLAPGGGADILIGLFSLIMIATVVFAAVKYCRAKNRAGDGLFVFMALCVLSIAAVLVINVFTDLSLRSIYLFVWYPLVAVSAVLLWKYTAGKPRTVCVLLMSFFVAVNLYCSYGTNVKAALSEDVSPEAAVCQWVEDNGYDIIYGEWNTAAEIAAYSDGDVTAGAWYTEPYMVLGYINPLDVYSEADNARAVHVLRPHVKDKALAAAEEQGAEMTLLASFADGQFELYKSSKQLMYFE